MNPNLVEDINEFHTKFGQGYGGPPRVLTIAELRFRAKCMKEEAQEFEEALNKFIDTENPAHLAAMLDAVVDSTYFNLGTCQRAGWDFYEAWMRVHEANMKKELAHPDNPGKRDFRFDVVKPAGWEAPNLEDLVR